MRRYISSESLQLHFPAQQVFRERIHTLPLSYFVCVCGPANILDADPHTQRNRTIIRHHTVHRVHVV